MNLSDRPIRFHEAHTPARAADYVIEALEANENVNGSFTQRCAGWLESAHQVPHVLMTHSATAALELAAMTLAVVHDAGRVYMPSYTFSSTANAFLRAGYELEFIDIDPTTMNAGYAEMMATNAEKNSVVVPVHYAGNPGEIDRISKWADERGVWVVEDAAQALGASLNGTSAGAFGVLGALSFHFTKNIHSSMGGALFINDPDLLDTATVIWERGTNRQAMLKGLVDKYSWIEVGSSFQATELQAALLLAGLEEYDRVFDHRRQLWSRYAERLGDLESTALFTQQWRPEAVNNYHAFYVRLDRPAATDGLRMALKSAGIDAYIGYVPLHSAPYGQRNGYDTSLPQTEKWAECVLRLPLHTGMSVSDAERVSATIESWLAVQ